MNIKSISMQGWSSDLAKCRCDYTFNPSNSNNISLLDYGHGRKKVAAIDPDYRCDLCLSNTYPRAPGVDKCIYCRMVDRNLEKKIWICEDRTLASDDKITLTKWNTDSLENIAEKVTPLEEYYDAIERPFRKHNKPQGRWFSAGSWIYDKCCGELHNCSDYNISAIRNKVVIIIDPKNILYVTNLQEFDDFIAKYYTIKPNTVDQIIKNLPVIDWEKVVSDGYFGTAFTFHNISAIGEPNRADFDPYKYGWHSGYDVESLIVWDYRAYNHKLYPIELYDPELEEAKQNETN